MARDWVYFTENDYGIRNDQYGRGDFSAPRGGWTRKHTGIDYLLDYQTDLVSPCDGEGRWDFVPAYGYIIDLVCSAPFKRRELKNFWFSIRYSHLDASSKFIQKFSKQKRHKLIQGQVIGAVGNSGNAKGTKPHLHLEVSVFESKKAARQAQHPLKDAVISNQANQFLNELKKTCQLAQDNIQNRALGLDNRIDPYVLFSCIGAMPIELLPHALQHDSNYPDFYLWSKHYDF